VASPQGYKVIGQPNGVTTIELSTPHSKKLKSNKREILIILCFNQQLMVIQPAPSIIVPTTWQLTHSLETYRNC
jgi:hypothetical protein